MALWHTSDIAALFLPGTLGTGALFQVWIMDQSQNHAEGRRVNPTPARWGISWGEKQHPATVGERLGSMDLFEVLVHVMVNLVLLELNCNGLICLEVGWGGGKEAELLVTPTSVCVRELAICGRILQVSHFTFLPYCPLGPPRDSVPMRS